MGRQTGGRTGRRRQRQRQRRARERERRRCGWSPVCGLRSLRWLPFDMTSDHRRTLPAYSMRYTDHSLCAAAVLSLSLDHSAKLVSFFVHLFSIGSQNSLGSRQSFADVAQPAASRCIDPSGSHPPLSYYAISNYSNQTTVTTQATLNLSRLASPPTQGPIIDHTTYLLHHQIGFQKRNSNKPISVHLLKRAAMPNHRRTKESRCTKVS